MFKLNKVLAQLGSCETPTLGAGARRRRQRSASSGTPAAGPTVTTVRKRRVRPSLRQVALVY